MSRFLHRLRQGPLLMDGAMGTELQSLDLLPGECGELWNIIEPDLVQAIHMCYSLHGAECLLTNTFQANPYALARHGREDWLEKICRAGLRLARKSADARCFVLGDVGPIHAQEGAEEFADVAALRRTVGALAGADGILLETCSSPRALDAAGHVGSWPETRHLPVLLSLTYRRHPDGRIETASGHPPEWFARRAKDYGVAVLGVNCGRDMGLTDVATVVRRYAQETDLPLLARPNAGQPTWTDGEWVYPLNREEAAHAVVAGFTDILNAGVAMVGGCCGTTAAHIGVLCAILHSRAS